MGFPATFSLPTSLLSFSSQAGDTTQSSTDWRDAAVANLLGRVRELVTKVIAELPRDCSSFRELEERLHRDMGRCLDSVMVAVLQAACGSDHVLDAVNRLLHSRPHLRCQKSGQEVTITFLGGTKHTLSTPYFLNRPPRGRGRPRGRGKRGPACGNGVYPFLAVLGIHNRATPALASEVALQVSCGTIDQAHERLARRGIKLGKKRIISLLKSVGSRALDYREQSILSGNATEIGSVVGRRLAVGTDGGRLRTRFLKKRGRKNAKGSRGFHAPWKEPKVLTLYEIDDDGKRLREHDFCYYDATMEDADQAFRILAGLLRSVGAAEAKEWIVVGDGARWIWNRIDDLIEEVGYTREQVTEVIDLYHARQKLYEFADAVKSFTDRQRRRWFGKMKRHLDKGNIEEMEAEFARFYRGCNSKARRKIAAYFHKNANRMRYKEFKERGIPRGSGAVESCVRRLVNLRMKGNGIFWTLENSERLLTLRGQYLSGTWDDFVDRILEPVEFWSSTKSLEAR